MTAPATTYGTELVNKIIINQLYVGDNILVNSVGTVLQFSDTTTQTLRASLNVSNGNFTITGALSVGDAVTTRSNLGLGSLSVNNTISLTTEVTGTLPVVNGGTGVATLTSGNVLVGAGTLAVTTTKVAPTGAFVGTTDTQTLTNKTFGATTFTGDLTSVKQLIIGSGQTTQGFDTVTGSYGGSLGVYDTGTGLGNGGAILFGANSGALKYASIKGYLTGINNNSVGDLVISTRRSDTDNSLTPSLIITHLGNIGISATPSEKLTVGGNISATGTISGSSLSVTDAVTTRSNLGLGSMAVKNTITLTTDVTGVLPVANGGTGANTLTSGNVLIGAGTLAVTTTKVAPTGDFVGTTDTQTLTNKTFGATTFTGNLTVGNISATGTISGSSLSVTDAVTTRSNLGLGSLAVQSTITLTTDVTGILPVANGGTGANTLTSGNVLVGAGTLAVTTTKVAPTGAFVGTTDTQTLTNKTFGATTFTGDLTSVKQLIIGSGQTTQGFDTVTGSYGGTLGVYDTGVVSGSGGAVIFGAGSGSLKYAVIKGYLTDNTNNSLGQLVISTRRVNTDVALTPAMIINSDGTIGINATPTERLTVGGNISATGTISASSLSVTDAVTTRSNLGLGSMAVKNTITLTTDVTGVLPVANGGTGANTLSAGNVLVGNGTAVVLTTKPAPTGDFVGTFDTQTLTNKTFGSSTFIGDLTGTNIVASGTISASSLSVTDAVTTRSNLGLGSMAVKNTITLTTDVTGVLPVANGGTGANTHFSGNVLVGAGTLPVTTTKVAPTGDFVGTTDTQTLTNKTFGATTFTGNLTVGNIVASGTLSASSLSVTDAVTTRSNLGLGSLAVKSTVTLTTDVTGILPVTNGGTGSNTLTSGNVLVGAGTLAVITTKVAPTGDFVGTTDTQTLTNKTFGATTFTGDLTSVKQLIIGSGQTTQGFDTVTGSYGGSLGVYDTGVAAGSGGAVIFGAGSGSWKYAAIKGYLTNGADNSLGQLVISTRRVSTDVALTPAMIINNDGTVGINATPTERLTVGGNISATGTIAGSSLSVTDATTTRSNLGLGSIAVKNTITLTTDVTGILPVTNGGTGANTLTSGNVLVGAGTLAVTTTKVAPTGDFVGTTDTQTLTNKTFGATTFTGSLLVTTTSTAGQMLVLNMPAGVTSNGLFLTNGNAQWGIILSGNDLVIRDVDDLSPSLTFNKSAGLVINNTLTCTSLIVTDATTTRSNLGLGTLAVQNANAVALTGGTIIPGVTITANSGADLFYPQNALSAPFQMDLGGSNRAFRIRNTVPVPNKYYDIYFIGNDLCIGDSDGLPVIRLTDTDMYINSNVGIGMTTSPIGKLHVALGTFAFGGNWTSNAAVFGGTAANSGALGISYDDTNGGTVGCIIPGVDWKPLSLKASDIVLYGLGTEYIRMLGTNGNLGIGNNNPGEKLSVTGNITASGTVSGATPTTGSHLTTKTYVDGLTQAVKPAFGARASGKTDVTGDGTEYRFAVPANEVAADTTGSWNTTTNQYTVPSTGSYHMGCTATITGFAGGELCEMYVRDANNLYNYVYVAQYLTSPVIGVNAMSCATVAILTAGQVMEFIIEASGGSKIVDLSFHNLFIFKVSN